MWPRAFFSGEQEIPETFTLTSSDVVLKQIGHKFLGSAKGGKGGDDTRGQVVQSSVTMECPPAVNPERQMAGTGEMRGNGG